MNCSHIQSENVKRQDLKDRKLDFVFFFRAVVCHVFTCNSIIFTHSFMYLTRFCQGFASLHYYQLVKYQQHVWQLVSFRSLLTCLICLISTILGSINLNSDVPIRNAVPSDEFICFCKVAWSYVYTIQYNTIQKRRLVDRRRQKNVTRAIWQKKQSAICGCP